VGGEGQKGRCSEKIGESVKLIYLYIIISLALAANLTCYDWLIIGH